jgi:hypothetical protein
MPGGIKGSRKAQPGPQAEHGKHTELARRLQIACLKVTKRKRRLYRRHMASQIEAKAILNPKRSLKMIFLSGDAER